MLRKLHHVAYRCRDAGETADFYTNLLGLRLAHIIVQDRVPSTQAYSPHAHIFFEMADGSYIAFFELAAAPPAQRDPNTPDWVQHLALEIDDEAELLASRQRLIAAGIDVVGPTDHGFCKSIYFFDPSGHRMELTARTDRADQRDRFAAEAPAALAAWQARKHA
jgi:glyoxylase I family protein